MIDHKWKCGVAGCNWTTYFWKRNPTDIRHERAHVADEGDEDNAEPLDEVPENEFETARWANDNDHGNIGRGTGNDFGLTATHAAPSGVGVARTTPATGTASYMCQVCSCPMISVSTNGPTCDACTKHEIKWYPTRPASYSIDVMDKIKTVALLYTIICIIQQLAEHVEVTYGDCKQWIMNTDGMHLPRIEFSAKQIAITMIITIVVTTIGSTHGATHVQRCVNNTIQSSAIKYDA